MTLAINESTKMPEAGRVLFDEVVARKRETLRQALTRGKMCGAVSDADIEMAALMDGHGCCFGKGSHQYDS